MKDRFVKELRDTGREGIDKLISAMEQGGFFEAPCSGGHHLATEGGLLEHSLNVLDCARELNNALKGKIEDSSVVIVALLHDLGKMGDHGKANYVQNILKDGKQSTAKPYVTNSELAYVPHECRSVWIAERYINLTEEEETAILWHNGPYSVFRNDIMGKETKLYLIIHTADMYASRFMENKEKEEKE